MPHRRRVGRPAGMMLLFVLGGALSMAPAQGQVAAATITTVEELRAAVAAGGVHVLAAAGFLIDEPLTATRDLTLIGAAATGAAAEATVLRVRRAAAGLIVSAGASVRLEGIDFDGVVSGTIAADGARDPGEGHDLIRVLDGRLEIAGGSFTRARYGPADDVKAYGRGSAVFVAGASTASIAGADLSDNQLAAVEVTGDGAVTIAASVLSGNLYGVFVEESGSLELLGSEIRGHRGAALIVRGSADAEVVGNEFIANGSAPGAGQPGSDGVRFGDSAVVRLSDNDLSGSPRYALSLYGGASVTSTGNSFSSNGGLVAAEGVERSALLVEDDAVMLSYEDVFSDNPGGAIEVFGRGRLELEGVQVLGNASVASVYAADDGVVVLRDAEVAANSGPVMAVGSAHLTIKGGSYRTSLAEAVLVVDDASLTLEEAELSDNVGYAVRVLDGAVAEIVAPLVTRNGGGIVFADRARGSVRGGHFVGNEGEPVEFRDDASGAVSGLSEE